MDSSLDGLETFTRAYEVSVVGAIKRLTDKLDSINQMVKELVQNADDAHATTIHFEINASQMVVTNDAELSFCSKYLEDTEECEGNPLRPDGQFRFCDVHALSRLASENKERSTESTGKFGVGFVSVFLITDRPEIHFDTRSMSLMPERGKVQFGRVAHPMRGTRILLPWALDASSQVRLELGKDAIEATQIQTIAADMVATCLDSLYFLRHLCEVVISHDGKPLLNLHKTTSHDGNSVVIEDRISGERHKWLRLQLGKDLQDHLISFKRLHSSYLTRRTDIEILVPTNFEEAFSGYLFATLPTEVSANVPVHIQADFFPHTDRNGIPFTDGASRPDARWNDTLLECAALMLADSISRIKEEIGIEAAWVILREAHRFASSTSIYGSSPLSIFWEKLRARAEDYELFRCNHDELHSASQLTLISATQADDARQVSDILGIHYQGQVHKDDNKLLEALGAKALSQERLHAALTDKFNAEKVSRTYLATNWGAFWLPLLSTIESLLSDRQHLIQALKDIEIWPSSERVAGLHVDLRKLIDPTQETLCRKTFPDVRLVDSSIQNEFLLRTIKQLDENDLYQTLTSREMLDHFQRAVSSSPLKQSAFEFMLDYMIQPSARGDVQSRWSSVCCWPQSGGRFGPLTASYLPGGFSDPIGIGNLLDPSYFSESSKEVLLDEMAVKELTLKTYISDLPAFLESRGMSPEWAVAILNLLTSVSNDMDTAMWSKVRSIPLVRSDKELLVTAEACLMPNEEMKKLFQGGDFHFVDLQQFSDFNMSDEDRDKLLNNLGASFEPTLDSLSAMWRALERQQLLDADTTSQLNALLEAILQLLQTLPKGSEIPRDVSALRFPCAFACKTWHNASELLRDNWRDALCDREDLHPLAIRIQKKQSKSAESLLGLTEHPPLSCVLDHLRHCANANEPVSATLDDLLEHYASTANETDLRALLELRSLPSLYSTSEKRYLTPAEIYKTPPQHLEFLDPFITVIDSAPEGKTNLWKLLEIPNELSNSKIVEFLPALHDRIDPESVQEEELLSYRKCISIIGTAFSQKELWALDYLLEFAHYDLTLTRGHTWREPAEVLVVDSTFWASRLHRQFDDYLVDVEAVAFDFLIEAGAKALMESLTILDDESTLDGARDSEMSDFIQSHANSMVGYISKVIVESEKGGRIYATTNREILDALLQVEVAHLRTINVGAMLELNGTSQRIELSDVGRLYLPRSNVAIYTKGATRPLYEILYSIMFHLLPGEEHSFLETKVCLLESILENRSSIEAYKVLSDRDLLDLEIEPTTEPKRARSEITFNAPAGQDTLREDELENQTSQTGDSDDPRNRRKQVTSDHIHPETELDATDDTVYLTSEIERPRHLSSNLAPSENRPRSTSPGENEQANSHHNNSRRRRSGGSENGDGSMALPPRESRSSSSKSSTSAGKSKNRGKAKSGYVYAESHGQGAEAHLRNASVDEAGIAFVKEKDWDIFRTVTDANDYYANNPGFDVISVLNADEHDKRFVEVKSLSGPWSEFGVGMTDTQIAFAQEFGDSFWLYVVEYALDPGRRRLHRIPNPWKHIRRIYFDDGWRHIAEISSTQNPPALWPGLRFLHPKSGIGEIISKPTYQGQAIYCEVLFEDETTPRRIIWDQDSELLEPDSDDS